MISRVKSAGGQAEMLAPPERGIRGMMPEESAEIRKRAIVGAGVYTGTTLEYWKKKA